MSGVHQFNDVIDNMSEVETKLDYAHTLICELLNDYDVPDSAEIRARIAWELPRVQSFLNIIFEFCFAARKQTKEIQSELSQICDQIKIKHSEELKCKEFA